MKNIVRAELRKLRYTRSLLAIPIAGIAVSVAAAAVLVTAIDGSEIAGQLSGHGPLRFGPTNVGLVLVIFAIRLVTDETHHRTLPTTFIANPRRLTVLTAKALLGAACTVAVCVAIYAAVIPTTVIALDARGIPMSHDLAETAALFGRVTAAMTLVTLLGVGVAAAVRDRVVALVACVIWIALAENVVGSLLHIEHYLPTALVSALVEGTSSAGLSAAPAAAALSAYVVVAFAAAVVSLRRDIA